MIKQDSKFRWIHYQSFNLKAQGLTSSNSLDKLFRMKCWKYWQGRVNSIRTKIQITNAYFYDSNRNKPDIKVYKNQCTNVNLCSVNLWIFVSATDMDEVNIIWLVSWKIIGLERIHSFTKQMKTWSAASNIVMDFPAIFINFIELCLSTKCT